MKILLNKKGFTLMEMMIVIAIIVILVAISIPTFSGSLEKAHRAADAANLRAAKASYIAQDMDGSLDGSKLYYYDCKQGKFVLAADDAAAKAAAKASNSLGSCKNHTDNYITINFANKKVVWTDGTCKEDCGTESN